MSDLGEDEQTGSYSIYFAEGETLAKQKQFIKAIESFTKVCYLYEGAQRRMTGCFVSIYPVE